MHPPRLTHVRALALVVVTLGVLTGCSNPLSDDELPKASAQDRVGRLLNAGEVKAALPSVASLPAGWAPAKNILRPKNTKDKFGPARCKALDHGLEVGYLRAKTMSYTTYINPRHAALGVGIGSHAEAPPPLGPVRAALRNCKSFRAVDGNRVTRVTVVPLRLPHLAPDAVVTRLIVQEGSTTATWDVVRIRVGHNEILADLVTPAPGKPNTKPLVAAVRNALLNLS
jgi:hypothetical protein